MPGHLVVVVHGIGEQEAGETVDAVLAGAIADHERVAPDHAISVETEVMQMPAEAFPPPKPKTSENAEKEAETSDKKSDREMPHFPMHLRHVRSVKEPEAPATSLVDVYWADISPAPNGQMRTLIDLVRTLLGTGYLAMENARSHGSRFSYRLVLGFVWAFFAGIASINFLLLIGLGLLLFDGVAYELVRDGGRPLLGYNDNPNVDAHFLVRAEILVFLAGLLTALFGGWIEFGRNATTQLLAQFARGLMFFGTLAIVFSGLTIGDPSFAPWFSGEPAEDTPYLNHFVTTVVHVLSYVWLTGSVPVPSDVSHQLSGIASGAGRHCVAAGRA